MLLKRLGLGTSILLLSSAAVASSYQFELDGGFVRIDSDGGGDFDTFLLTGEYHFAPVDTRNQPLAEAGFMQRSSNVFGAVSRTELGPVDLDLLGAGVEYYVPDTMFYLGGEVVRLRASNGFSQTETGWSVAAGVTPLHGMRLRLTYSDQAPSFAFGFLEEAWTADFKYVIPTAAGSAVNVEAAVTVSDGADVYSVGGDYYFTPRFSLGAVYDHVDARGNDNAFTVRGQAFFQNSLNVSAFGTFFDDETVWGVALGFRF